MCRRSNIPWGNDVTTAKGIINTAITIVNLFSHNSDTVQHGTFHLQEQSPDASF